MGRFRHKGFWWYGLPVPGQSGKCETTFQAKQVEVSDVVEEIKLMTWSWWKHMGKVSIYPSIICGLTTH